MRSTVSTFDVEAYNLFNSVIVSGVNTSAYSTESRRVRLGREPALVRRTHEQVPDPVVQLPGAARRPPALSTAHGKCSLARGLSSKARYALRANWD